VRETREAPSPVSVVATTVANSMNSHQVMTQYQNMRMCSHHLQTTHISLSAVLIVVVVGIVLVEAVVVAVVLAVVVAVVLVEVVVVVVEVEVVVVVVVVTETQQSTEQSLHSHQCGCQSESADIHHPSCIYLLPAQGCSNTYLPTLSGSSRSSCISIHSISLNSLSIHITVSNTIH